MGVRVYYDYASVLSYVAHRVMGQLADDLDLLEIDLVWRPIDLTRITGWRRGFAIPEPRRTQVLETAATLGFPARMPERWIDSRPASAVALALNSSAEETAWRTRIWRAVFEEGCDLADPGDVPRLAADIGIAAGDCTSPEALARVEAETRAAYDAHVNAVPTFMLGNWPFSGIQEADTMRAIFARWTRRLRDEQEH
ncbi:DsbA family protein [Candidatus Binatia bacterium]|nr:DsbA family protein [Candidatus Binatia bacterium]